MLIGIHLSDHVGRGIDLIPGWEGKKNVDIATHVKKKPGLSVGHGARRAS